MENLSDFLQTGLTIKQYVSFLPVDYFEDGKLINGVINLVNDASNLFFVTSAENCSLTEISLNDYNDIVKSLLL